MLLGLKKIALTVFLSGQKKRGLKMFGKKEKKTMQQQIAEMQAGEIFSMGKHKYKKTAGGNHYRLQTREELRAHKTKQSCSKFKTSGHFFQPLLFLDDMYVRTTKINGENFYSLADVAFHYSQAISPITNAIKNTEIRIEHSNTDAEIIRFKNGFLIANWSALKVFTDVYRPRDFRNEKLKALLDSEEIYPSNKIATSHSGELAPQASASINNQNAVFPILMDSIKAGKNIAGINKIFENGGLKSLVDEMLAGNIPVVLSQYFNSDTIDELMEVDIFDFQKITAKEINAITTAIKEKLSLDKSPPVPPVSGLLGTVSQLVSELTGKKLVVTFELK